MWVIDDTNAAVKTWGLDGQSNAALLVPKFRSLVEFNTLLTGFRDAQNSRMCARARGGGGGGGGAGGG